MGFLDGLIDVAEHIEHGAENVVNTVYNDGKSAVGWVGDRFTAAEDTGLGAVKMMEYLPYLAMGGVVFLVLNSNKTSQIIDSGANAASQFRR